MATLPSNIYPPPKAQFWNFIVDLGKTGVEAFYGCKERKLGRAFLVLLDGIRRLLLMQKPLRK